MTTDLPRLPEAYDVLGRFVDERKNVYTADQMHAYARAAIAAAPPPAVAEPVWVLPFRNEEEARLARVYLDGMSVEPTGPERPMTTAQPADDVDWSTPLTPERMAYLHDKHHGPAAPPLDDWTDPHPPTRHCMCPSCIPSFDDRFAPPVYQETLAVLEKLHEGKLGAHWLWMAMQQVAAGGKDEAVLAEFGWVRAIQPLKAATP